MKNAAESLYCEGRRDSRRNANSADLARIGRNEERIDASSSLCVAGARLPAINLASLAVRGLDATQTDRREAYLFQLVVHKKKGGSSEPPFSSAILACHNGAVGRASWNRSVLRAYQPPPCMRAISPMAGVSM